MRKRIQKILSSIFGPVVLIFFTTLLLKWVVSILNGQNIALLYLIPVMISTFLWGLIPGLLTSFLSFLTFNYFFIKPYNTLLVHQSQDLLTLIIFLAVAIVMSQLIGQERKAGLVARTKEWEATRMYELISSLAEITSVEMITKTIADKLFSTFQFDQVEVEVNENNTKGKVTGCIPDLKPPERLPEVTRTMKTQRQQEGVIHIWHHKFNLSDAETRLLDAYCDQSALAIERIRLTEGKNRLQVLEQSDLVKTSLLNSVSHELRSPLAAIKASISSLRSGTVDWNNSARNDLVAMVDEETDRLNLLVGNLLDMSRIESGSLKPNLRWNSIVEIAMGVASKMRSQLQDHSINFDFPQELPLVSTDYVMIEQVFTNLISNSIKYAPVNTQIQISAQKDDETLKVIIKNQSPAVEEENLEHIFEKFYRVTQADKVIGTGLGLSICKGIIEAHGGKIWAENVTDGFRFVFTLPLNLNGNYPDFPEEITNG
jgi:two-component system sensor histidine kinase KdpD